jgi:CDP-diacylglycerol--serine O-phosphatidyltransferase
VPFIAAFLLVLLLVLVSTNPPQWLFGLFILYGLSGHILYLVRLVRRKPASPAV